MRDLDFLLDGEDKVALRTRLHLLGDRDSQETRLLERRVVEGLADAQLPNGSWDNTIYRTLSNIRLLIDLGLEETEQFQESLEWIMSLKGPLGFHEYCEEGEKVRCRDEHCPYGSKLGTPEFTGRVLHLFGKMGFDDPIVDESVESVWQFQRYDGGFHGPRFWEEDQRSCIGATLWVTRGLLSLGLEKDAIESAIDFIEAEEIEDSPYQFSNSALTLETLHLYGCESENECVKRHMDYLLSLKDGEGKWRCASDPDQRARNRAVVFLILDAIRKLRPEILNEEQYPNQEEEHDLADNTQADPIRRPAGRA